MLADKTTAMQKWEMFEERRSLVNKWFEKWTDGQRKRVLEDLLLKCKNKQIEYAGDIVNQKRPLKKEDFTRVMPRVISVYIFSFLDPRSLCRCSSVCWYWRTVAELDQLWMPKCVRLGWSLPFTPSPYETGVWKRLYIENVSQIKFYQPKLEATIGDIDRLSFANKARSKKGTPRPSSGLGNTTPGRPGSAAGNTTPGRSRPPWKGSDPTPKDTWRNNYLENDDEIEKVNKLQKRGMYGEEAKRIRSSAKTKLNTRQHTINTDTRSMSRSKSLVGLGEAKSPTNERPDWATMTHPSAFTSPNGTATAANLNTSLRPAPVVNHSSKKEKTHKKEETTDGDIFSGQPWNVPADGYDSDT